MTEFGAAARPAAWLALALIATAWPGRPAELPACVDPREARSSDSSDSSDPAGGRWTRAVVCEGDRKAPVRGPARRLFGLGLDANDTDAPTLETLPGIGPARARALVEARREQRFCRARDLERAEGIGPRIRAMIAAELVFPEHCREGPALGPSGRESW